MSRTMTKFAVAMALSFAVLYPASVFCQSDEPVSQEAAAEDAANADAPAADELIADIKSADSAEEALSSCETALARCKTYDDYEKLSAAIKKLIIGQRNYNYPDILHYACALTRIEELSYLTKKNDIDSGRIYMSVNEQYYNDALECLDKAALASKSRDLIVEIAYLRFIVFRELFQPEKVDAVFNEMVDKIRSYSEDAGENLVKLNEISKKLSDRHLGEYAMKLKLIYASKVEPESAQMIAGDIKADADIYFDEGNTREAARTYDAYLQLAENYYDKATMPAKIMEIAEKYFNKGNYKEAVKYYSQYLFKYSASEFADYASYKLALCYYNDRDYTNAIGRFEEFLKTYQNSVWFEKSFETLCRIYYETLLLDKAVEKLQGLIDTYPRRETRDYAQLLIGILYYNKTDYDKALAIFKKLQENYPRSAYLYATETLINDITEIKRGQTPSFSFGSKDVYKVWEPYMPINADIGIGEGAEVVENKDAKPGELYVKTKAGSKVTFVMNGLEDMDRFNEFWQDSEDESRLPRKIKDETEKDLVFFTWLSADGGKFPEDKQTISRAWQAPKEPGAYTITINIGDLGLVRPPDSGSKKDTAKSLTIHVTVE